MFKYNSHARDHLNKMRENLVNIERQLVAKESYLAASTEMRNNDRQRLLAETKLLLREVAMNGGWLDNESKADNALASSPVVDNSGRSSSAPKEKSTPKSETKKT
jgi:hypothetical protein